MAVVYFKSFERIQLLASSCSLGQVSRNYIVRAERQIGRIIFAHSIYIDTKGPGSRVWDYFPVHNPNKKILDSSGLDALWPQSSPSMSLTPGQ